MGGGSAGNLAARYSATDLSPPGHAARHLSLVVWAATIGSVAGPNLAEPADRIGLDAGLAGKAGPFAFAALAFAVSAGRSSWPACAPTRSSWPANWTARRPPPRAGTGRSGPAG